jgi:hypothetical protein
MHIDSFRLIIYPQKQKSFHHRKQPIKFSYHRWKQLTETVFPNCAHSWIEQCDLNTSSLTVNRNFQTEGTSWYFVCLIFRASNFLFSYQANSNTFQNLRKIDKKKNIVSKSTPVINIPLAHVPKCIAHSCNNCIGLKNTFVLSNKCFLRNCETLNVDTTALWILFIHL